MKQISLSPKISIIMPTYNRASFLLETIESIQNQTYANWELVIVDDASTDHTEELIRTLTDQRIRYLKVPKTGIGIRLRSAGIEKASGEWIAFMDSDDLWDPQKLAKQVQEMNAYPEAGFSLTGGFNFREKGKPVEYFYKQREGLRFGNILAAFFTSEVAILLPTLLMKKECLPVIQEHVAQNPDSDLAFMMGLAAHFQAVVLYEPLFYRRIHEGNFSTASWERGYVEMIHIIHSYRIKQLISVSLARNSLFRLYINYGEKLLRFRLPVPACQKFFLAWKNKPISIVPLKKISKGILFFLREIKLH
jgi:glycosyltransferase involved in cell wall biosynthesis